MDQRDRFKGHVRVLTDGNGGHGLDISGDVPAYIAIDAIGQIVKSNAVNRRQQKAERLQRLGIQAGSYGLAFMALFLVALFTFGGCGKQSSPSTHYQQQQSW